MKIYVASSWKNEQQPAVVARLRAEGHEVYDFRNPREGDHGFSWRQISAIRPPWSAIETRRVLQHAVANRAHYFDRSAMEWCDVCVMVQPCGRSAAYELGRCIGAGKLGVVLLVDDQEPELMFKEARLCVSMDEVVDEIRVHFFGTTLPRSAAVIVRKAHTNGTTLGEDWLYAAIRSNKHGGKLQLPGGKALPGEKPYENARRETLEEVGLYLSDMTPILVSNVGGFECTTFIASSVGELISSDEGEAAWSTASELLQRGVYPDHTRRWLELVDYPPNRPVVELAGGST